VRGLDAHITGGRYSSCPMRVRCAECDEWTAVVAETEYGATTWTPEECGNPNCGAAFEGDEDWVDDEPPEPEPRDYDEEDR
jgi:hypothetical protein